MPRVLKPRAEPELRDHNDCLSLTVLTLQQLQPDGPLGKHRKVSKSEFVWKPTTQGHNLYFLQRGQIIITLADSECEVIIRVIKPGESFGELCFCPKRGGPRPDCAQAFVDSQILEISFDEIVAHFRRSPEALKSFAFTLCQRLTDAERRISVLANRSATARLGELLLQLSEKQMPSTKKPNSVKLAFGHDELARMAAMTRSHVSVTMGKFRSLRLVHYDRASQLAVDVAGLKKYLSNASKTNSET